LKLRFSQYSLFSSFLFLSSLFPFNDKESNYHCIENFLTNQTFSNFHSTLCFSYHRSYHSNGTFRQFTRRFRAVANKPNLRSQILLLTPHFTRNRDRSYSPNRYLHSPESKLKKEQNASEA
jgi:hypothetical protein